MRIVLRFLLCLVLSISGYAQTVGGNATVTGALQYADAVPVISNVTPSSDANTIVAKYQLQTLATSTLACGTTSGSYTKNAIDNSVVKASNQKNVVEGLSPSTTYYCQITATNSAGSATATFSIATLSYAGSTPITGVSFGPFSTYNAINANNQGHSDTFYNCKSTDNRTYFIANDTGGFTESGLPVNPDTNSALTLTVFTNESPLAAKAVNYFNNYGPCCTPEGTDGRSEKAVGLFCMEGNLYVGIGRQLQGAHAGLTETDGQIIWSPDHGASWNNYQTPAVFNASGNVSNPLTAAMFGTTPSTFALPVFIMYCGDDGTLGYTNTCDRVDNANAFIYVLANEGVWNGAGPSNGGGNAYYLARVPRALINRLNISDYQYFTGGDGSLDSNWSSSESSAVAILSNYGELGTPNVQYIPALNRYILLDFYYPNGAGSGSTALDTTWLTYEAPHLWGPWTLVNTTNWPTQGYYNPIILNDTIYTGTAPTIMFTGDFYGGGTASYQMYLSTMAILTGPLTATPTASPTAGAYSSTQTVTLSTSTGGATICYTTDGSTPTASVPGGTCTHGSTYSSAISVSSTQTIQAVATLSGDSNSSVLVAGYVIGAPSAQWDMADGSGTTFADSSGNSNNQTFTSGIGSWGTVSGYPGSAFTFNGTGSSVAANNTLTNFSGTTAFTISAWIAPTTGAQQVIASTLDSSNNLIGWEFQVGSPGNIGLYLINNYTGNNYLGAYTTTAISFSTIHHVVATYDGSKNTSGVQIFVDGVQQTLIVAHNGLTGSISNTLDVHLGARANGAWFFTGPIGDVRIYPTNLNSAEVEALYAGGPQ